MPRLSNMRSALIILSSFLLVSFFGVDAQPWKVISYGKNQKKEISLLGDRIKVDFCFIGSNNCKANNIDGLVIVKDPKLKDALNYFEFPSVKLRGFENPVHSHLKYGGAVANLKCTYFSKNIKRFFIGIKTTDGTWIAKEFSPTWDGFNEPLASYLTTWYNGVNANDSILVESVLVAYESQNSTTESRLVFGEFTLCEFNAYTVGENLPVLNSYLFGTPVSNVSLLREYAKWSRAQRSTKVNAFVNFDEFGVYSGYLAEHIQLESIDSHQDEAIILSRLIRFGISFYPHYEDRKLDGISIRQKFEELIAQKKDSKDLILALKDFVNDNFQDLHFSINFKNNPVQDSRTMGPVRFKNIGGNIVVVGVFNDLLRHIPIGSVVTEVDGEVIGSRIDLNRLFLKRKSDTLNIQLSIAGTKETTNVSIPYSIPSIVPANFRAVHGKFQLSEDSVAYLSLTNWTGDCAYLLLNHRSEILKSKGLVLDLRGNGGGYLEDALKSLSLFLSTPSAIGEMGHYWLNESLIVFPSSQHIRFSRDLKIEILVDNVTACASEVFLIGLKNRQNTIVVGESNTAGAIASPTLYTFPSGLSLKMHTQFRTFVFSGNYYRAGEGIKPDVIVSRTDVSDLNPYEDKVKQIAYSLINFPSN